MAEKPKNNLLQFVEEPEETVAFVTQQLIQVTLQFQGKDLQQIQWFQVK